MRIQELHDRLFDLLILIQQICAEHDVRFAVAYGTAIGAVREQDFIPWDDDMDILVLSEDYPKFKEVMDRYLPQYIHLIEPVDFSPLFYDYSFRIVDERWLIREETAADQAYRNYQNHVGCDVFICCGCPKTKFGQKLFMLKNKILYGMSIQYRFEQDYSNYTPIQKAEVSFLRLLGKLYSGEKPDRICQRWLKLLSRYDGNKTGWRFVLNAPLVDRYQKTMPDSWFHGKAAGKIRGKDIPVIPKYDDFLRAVYGNYMTPEKNEGQYFTHLDEEDRQE